MNALKTMAIKTPIYHPTESLETFLWEALDGKLKEGMIVAITSKIVSLAEKRWVARNEMSKKDLILQEADRFLCETEFGVTLTIKHGVVIPSAGIDESNSENGDYLLFPKDPFESAAKIHRHLKNKSGVKNLGVIITDSNITPLRKGVLGVGLSHWGFKATRDLVGQDDLFGRKLRMTSVNLVDALAVAAVLVMGESSECQPIALIDYQGLEFTEHTNADEIQMPTDEDLYGPLLNKE